MALLAGLIDAMVGGGGDPGAGAVQRALPGMPPATVFGTNKFSAIAGTATASLRYARSIRIDWRIAAPASLAALLRICRRAHGGVVAGGAGSGRWCWSCWC